MLTNQNCTREEIKNRFKSENACYHSVQNLLFPCLLPENIKMKTHRIITFNPLNTELNPIRHFLALVGARHIVHVSRVRVNVVLCDVKLGLSR